MIDVKERKTLERGVQKRWTWPLLDKKILIGRLVFRSLVNYVWINKWKKKKYNMDIDAIKTNDWIKLLKI